MVLWSLVRLRLLLQGRDATRGHRHAAHHWGKVSISEVV